jgi:hypothetical protein
MVHIPYASCLSRGLIQSQFRLSHSSSEMFPSDPSWVTDGSWRISGERKRRESHIITICSYLLSYLGPPSFLCITAYQSEELREETHHFFLSSTSFLLPPHILIPESWKRYRSYYSISYLQNLLLSVCSISYSCASCSPFPLILFLSLHHIDSRSRTYPFLLQVKLHRGRVAWWSNMFNMRYSWSLVLRFCSKKNSKYKSNFNFKI